VGGTRHSEQVDARISLQHTDRVLAKSPAAVLRSNQAGQVLAFFALVLPLVLLPVAAYAVDASIVAGREAGLQAATAQAAETAAQQLNIGAIRSTGALTLDATAVSRVAAQVLVEEEQGARVDSYTVAGTDVTVVTSESVTLPFSIFIQTVTLHALATARLVAGYDKAS
jgi:Flp pilus assembly protein TadG